MRSRFNTALFIFLIISIFFFLFGSSYPISIIQNLIQKSFKYPLGFLYEAKVGKPDQNSEIFRLRNQNQTLIEQLAEFENLKKDNEALKDQFEEPLSDDQKLLPSRVIGVIGSSASFDSLIIDKGESDGLKKGMAVILNKNLVGKVDKTSPSLSKIILPIHRNFSTVGLSLKTQAKGVIQGEGDFTVLTNVSVKEVLEKDDIIVTKGDVGENGLGIAPDLIIGKISSVNKSESKPLQDAKIEPLIDYSRLTIVFLIIEN